MELTEEQKQLEVLFRKLGLTSREIAGLRRLNEEINSAMLGDTDDEDECSCCAEEPDTATPTVDLDSMTTLDKARMLINDTLNKLLIEEIKLENVQELLTTMQAVALYYQTHNEYKNV